MKEVVNLSTSLYPTLTANSVILLFNIFWSHSIGIQYSSHNVIEPRLCHSLNSSVSSRINIQSSATSPPWALIVVLPWSLPTPPRSHLSSRVFLGRKTSDLFVLQIDKDRKSCNFSYADLGRELVILEMKMFLASWVFRGNHTQNMYICLIHTLFQC